MEIDETSEEKCCVNIMVNDIDVLLLNKSGFMLSFIFEIVIETCIYFCNIFAVSPLKANNC